MSNPQDRTAPRSISPLLLAAVVAAAVAGLAAVWAALAYRSGGNAAWMGLVAAVDAALLLRLAGQPRGTRRGLVALLITLLTAAFAAALIAATQVGIGLGMLPGEALLRMSPELVLLYARANAGGVELAWLAGAGALAWFGGR